MAFLFDTDAISEVLRRKPAPRYLHWLATIPRREQFTSAVVLGELYKGAFRSADSARHLKNIDDRVLPAISVLPYDGAVARTFGEIHVTLTRDGRILTDADLQIAAPALHHGLELVTGNVRHFDRVPRLRINRILSEARSNAR